MTQFHIKFVTNGEALLTTIEAYIVEFDRNAYSGVSMLMVALIERQHAWAMNCRENVMGTADAINRVPVTRTMNCQKDALKRVRTLSGAKALDIEPDLSGEKVGTRFSASVG